MKIADLKFLKISLDFQMRGGGRARDLWRHKPLFQTSEM